MTIETLITAGDHRPSPYFPLRPQEKPSNQGQTMGSFEDALRRAK